MLSRLDDKETVRASLFSRHAAQIKYYKNKRTAKFFHPKMNFPESDFQTLLGNLVGIVTIGKNISYDWMKESFSFFMLKNRRRVESARACYELLNRTW